MPEDMVFEVFINPLAFLEVDEPWTSGSQEPPDLHAVLRLLCTPGIGSDIEDIVERYRAISTEPKRIIAAPREENILQKLVWPLRNAKASYMVGNYIGTISLCGMVGEMAAILFFEISEITINGNPLDENIQVNIFGSRFERLGQERRVNVLSAYGLIDEETEQAFDTIKQIRRRYLHFYSQKHTNISSDAIQIFHAAVTAVVNLIGQDIHEGRIVLKPAFRRYLERLELIQPVKEDDESD